MLKKIQIVPDNDLEFLENMNRLNVSIKIKKFIMDCYSPSPIKVDECDDFYIDVPYKYNFYNYSQKQDVKFTVKTFQKGYRKKEINMFNYDYNFIDSTSNMYIKQPTKKGYYEYYDHMLKYPQFKIFDNYVRTERLVSNKLDDLVFDDEVIDKFIQFLIMNFTKYGTWINNFNNYSIRYDEVNGFFLYDIDVCYVCEHNDDLKTLDNELDFVEAFKKYKLGPKTITYRLKDNKLDVESATYLYYTYWFLENVAQRIHNDY